ncbi:DUF2087 domain-containing protein [Neorhizobium petrolearium]|uniref:DUF2087 domain-containing protein n=1 Tax=Neorhizobium petrolearium TaxID=515361 RepID=A0ABY8M7G9_9HYPH|nr:DUF2087 domain-containing protein [Neorhizobium petrolearium]MCC2609744.1 DUF2087 domain-containing protein [Neorhizobium petrolearium]WGI69936.1 DUF2087 domain-containing protein [Neorhizobium petrolearium]
MSRSIFPMEIADLSAFAKSVREQIGRLDHKPSHVETLNLLSRAAGFRNYQHFRSVSKTSDVLDSWNIAAAPEPGPDEARVLKTIRVFDAQGRIVRWPGKRSQQELCLWFLWSKIPRGRTFTEREISEFLNTLHLFGDAALLRRDLFDLGLVTRKRDGSDYRRIEKKPVPELKLLLQRVDSGKAEAA